jgi:hypothetical protein
MTRYIYRSTLKHENENNSKSSEVHQATHKR